MRLQGLRGRTEALGHHQPHSSLCECSPALGGGEGSREEQGYQNTPGASMEPLWSPAMAVLHRGLGHVLTTLLVLLTSSDMCVHSYVCARTSMCTQQKTC
jgi:hypothetical protein